MRNLKDTCVFIWAVASILALQQTAQPRLRWLDLDTGECWFQSIDKNTGQYAVEYDGDEPKAKTELRKFVPPLKIVDAKGKVVAVGQKR